MSTSSALGDVTDISGAWLQAVRHLRDQPGRDCFNLIYSVTDPATMTDGDRALYARFDNFAREAGVGTSTTVANTIFPLDTYLAYGREGLYSHYEEEIFPQVRVRWGTYFDRMIRRRGPDGNLVLFKSGEPVNPLDLMIMKLRKRASTGRGTKNHYEIALVDEAFELTTYLPESDCNYPLGGPCLSHLSFKVDNDGLLRLIALYRSHYYLERALGNLLGLARLQSFVAVEGGFDIGPLTCIAAHACLEPSLNAVSAQGAAEFLKSCGV